MENDDLPGSDRSSIRTQLNDHEDSLDDPKPKDLLDNSSDSVIKDDFQTHCLER